MKITRRLQKFCLVVCLLSIASQGYSAASFKFGGQTLTVPDGFVVELIAGPPLVDRPITGDFDEQGRLYVADSSGSNEPVKEQLAKKPHRIVRLEDTNGDGVFDKQVVFADKMMFPAGTLWLNDSLYVTAPPAIWKLTDTNADGVADQREEWLNPGTLTGCANDLHGPYLGPEGLIYWCKGAFAKQEYDQPNGRKLTTRAAHIFRRRADGGFVESVMTGGMDNPVEVAFSAGGERFFSTTFLQNPGGGKRDGIIHAIYGGVYGKIHDVIDEHPRTGEVMPVMTHMGPAASCALMAYESGVFGEEFRGNLFSSSFNLSKVSRHILIPDGATFKTEDSDFLVSDSADFHPTRIMEDADGSLIVIDTGGWYKLCCPTSQLQKPDVLGAIYRIRAVKTPPQDDPRGLKLNWTQSSENVLAERLTDQRLAVQKRALEALAQRENRALPELEFVLRGSSSARTRAIWTLARIDTAESRALVINALGDRDEIVRQAAIHVIAVWREKKALPALVTILDGKSPQNKRAAAEALGRLEDSKAIPALLNIQGGLDRVLEHSLIYALIEINDPKTTRAGLDSPDPRVRKIAMTALDQMATKTLKPSEVSPYLSSTNSVLRETANWIVSRHNDWGGELAEYFKSRLSKLSTEDALMIDQLAGLAKSPEVQSLLAQTLLATDGSPSSKTTALKSMSRAGVKQAPENWKDGVAHVLSQHLELQLLAVQTARTFSRTNETNTRLKAALTSVALDGSKPAANRLEALLASPAILTESGSPELFELLLDSVGQTKPIAERSASARLLSRAPLSSSQRLRLAAAIEKMGPMELSVVLPAFAQPEPELGASLVRLLPQSSGFKGLRVDQLQSVFSKHDPSLQQKAEALYAMLNQDLKAQQSKIESLLKELPEGDIRKGQAIFNGTKAACSSCHAIGYLGGKLGPDLTSVGQIRSRRDLLEAIIYPSSSFVRSYEPQVVVTREGTELNGIVTQENSDELVLALGPNSEQRIPRSEIVETKPGNMSVMPSGLNEVISKEELADLLAFLKNTK